MDHVIWGFSLRFVQALVAAAPTLLIGFIVAALFRRLLGFENTRKVFGGNSWRALPQAWVIGMLLPVCSLGVIPIARELKRAGVSGGAILAFCLTAPLFNPISVLYGLTLSAPLVIIVFSLCSLVIVTVAGLLWDYWFPGTGEDIPDEKAVCFGWKRILATFIATARESASASAIYILIGLVGVSLLSTFLPYGCLQYAAEASDPKAILFMTGIAIPIYAPPMQAMVQLAAMFQHGNSVGASFTLLALGAGANLGMAGWMLRTYGVKRSLAFFFVLLVVVIGLSYAVDKPLYPADVDPVGHTHAFDIYCNPFHFNTQNAYQTMVRTIRDETEDHSVVALMTLGCLVVLGGAFNLLDRERRLETWLQNSAKDLGSYDVILPDWILGGVGLIGLVVASVLGTYIYYPPTSEIFKELKIANVEVVGAVNAGDWEVAEHWIPIYEDWTRKLEVSMFLRGQKMTPFLQAKTQLLRDQIETLEHELAHREHSQAKTLALQVNRSFMRLRVAFGEDNASKSNPQ